MNILAETFTSNGFLHCLVRRSGMVACYRRARIGGKARHFETVIVGTHKESTIQTAKGPYTYPAGEHYPSSERWGSEGFTFNEEAPALAKMEVLQQELTRRREKTK